MKVCPALEVGEALRSDRRFGITSRTREDPDVGRFIESYVGYSHRHRRKAASGEDKDAVIVDARTKEEVAELGMFKNTINISAKNRELFKKFRTQLINHFEVEEKVIRKVIKKNKHIE